MPREPRFTVTWTLRASTTNARAVADALAPVSAGHHTLAVDEDALRASGRGDAGTCLHTLDALLACLGAADGSIDAADRA